MKIFVTGVTGYIGGSIAEELAALGHQVTGLVRSEANNSELRARKIEPINGSLDDIEVLMRAASAADVTINAASADHSTSVVTLVAALERTGKTLIHTSGSAVVADLADGEYARETPYTEDCYFEPVPFRRPRVDMNRYLRQAAIEKGVRSIVICPAMIYGTGRGLQPDSDQIPKLIALSRHVGAGVYFGKGLNRYSNVHINDLVSLYLLAMEKAPGGSLFFAENGHNSFLEIAGMISHVIGAEGRTVSLPVAEVTREYGQAGRFGVASNSFVSAANARRLGWSPTAPSLEEWMKSLPKTGG